MKAALEAAKRATGKPELLKTLPLRSVCQDLKLGEKMYAVGDPRLNRLTTLRVELEKFVQ